jgi:hypothetical protein
VTSSNAGFDPDAITQEPVQKNAVRGAWRAFSRLAKRPILLLLLRNLQTADLNQVLDPKQLRRLRWAWANPNSADVEYLAAVANAAATTEGAILECGSGLSTVVVGVIAIRKGRTFTSLEHSAWWSRSVRSSLKVAGASAVDYQVKPLRSYEGFEWYDPQGLEGREGDITLVICDGPPATSQGGRYGLMPVLSTKLSDSGSIFLDDYGRLSEESVVSRWEAEFGWSLEQVYSSAKGQFASLTKTKTNTSSD